MASPIQITIDALDPRALGAFWAGVLGYVEQPPPDGFESWEAWAEQAGVPAEDMDRYYAVVDPDGAGPRVFFQRVPEAKSAKNRVHLDVYVSEMTAPFEERSRVIEAEVQRLEGLGATRGKVFQESTGVWTVMTDPEGNEFCVC